MCIRTYVHTYVHACGHLFAHMLVVIQAGRCAKDGQQVCYCPTPAGKPIGNSSIGIFTMGARPDFNAGAATALTGDVANRCVYCDMFMNRCCVFDVCLLNCFSKCHIPMFSFYRSANDINNHNLGSSYCNSTIKLSDTRQLCVTRTRQLRVMTRLHRLHGSPNQVVRLPPRTHRCPP